MKTWQLSFLLITLVLPSALKAQSFMTASAGGYSLSASGGTKAFEKSGPGAYRLAYAKRFYRGFHLNAGYNLLIESGVTGDQAYGLDIGITWLFLNETLRQETFSGDVNLLIESAWSPFIGASFNQRSYQSSKTSYSGAGLNVGVMFPLLRRLGYMAELRWNKLDGPTQSSISEKALLMGVMYYF